MDQTVVSQPESPTPHTSSKSRWGLLLLPFVVLSLALFGAYYAYSTAKTNLVEETPQKPNVQRVVEAGKIVIGTDATYPPMEFTDANNAVTGYDIDLGNKVAEELGITAEFVSIPWDDLFTALQEKKVDMIMSSVTITDERKQTYDFSDQYINAGQVIITRNSDTTIKSTADLKGKKIAVQKGTTNEQQAVLYTSADMVLTYDDFIGATDALLTSKADAVFSDLTNAKGIVDKNPGLKIASDPFTSEYYGIVFRKGEDDLVAQVNGALNSLRQRGVLVLLKQKWLE